MQKNQTIRLLKQFFKSKPVNKAYLFGSVARGDVTPNSDLDILVQFEKPIGLDFVTLAEELESLLQVKVDLVSINAIKPKMMDYVKESLIYV